MKQFIRVQLPFWLWLLFCAGCFWALGRQAHPSHPFPIRGPCPRWSWPAVGLVAALALGVAAFRCRRPRQKSPRSGG